MDVSIREPEGRFDLTARAVILRDGHVLMVKDHLGRYFYCVGGRVQLHEGTAQAALREAQEETGALFEVERLLFVGEEFFGEDHYIISFYYLLRHTGGEIRATTDEGEELVWLPVGRLGEYRTYPVFFAAELPRLGPEIKHFVTRE